MKQFLFACFALTIFSGCSLVNDDDENYDEAKIDLSVSSLAFDINGGKQTLAVNANDTWTVTDIPTWAEFSQDAGYKSAIITVTVKNATTTNLNHTVTITCRGLSKKLLLSQIGAAVTLTVAPQRITFEASGTIDELTKPLTIATNSSWTIVTTSLPSWCTIVDGNNTGTNNGIAELRVTANDGDLPRNATITVTAGNGSKTATVDIEQVGKLPTLSVDQTSLNSGAAGGNLKFNITSNSQWTVNKIPSWISSSALGGTGNQEITLIVEPNPTNVARIMTIEIQVGNTLLKEIRIEQDAKIDATLSLSEAIVEFDALGGARTINITSNSNWAMSPTSLPAWCTVSPMSGTGDVAIQITVTNSETPDIRALEVTISTVESIPGVSPKIATLLIGQNTIQ